MTSAAALAFAALLPASVTFADGLAETQAVVDNLAGRKTTWDDPTASPAAGQDKTIVVLATDMKNGGILNVANGIEEAAKVIGWEVRVLDGAGSISGRTAAFNQAMALSPDGIAIKGFDAVEQKVGWDATAEAKVPLVAWHAAPVIGPVEGTPVVANVSTDPMEVSAAAASWAYVEAGGAPKAVIFIDSTYQSTIAKTDRMKKETEKLGGEFLEYVDTPIADTSTRMPQLTTTLLKRHSDAWTHSLAINDLYFDFMGSSLRGGGRW